MARRRLMLHTSSEGVRLKEFILRDSLPLFALIDKNREHLSQFGDITARKYTTYHRVRDSIKHPKDPSRIRFGIWHRNTLVGSCNLTFSSDEESAEVGYWLGSAFTGKGFATIATKALIAYAFSLPHITRVFAGVHEANTRSVNVLQKAGLTQQEEKVGDILTFAVTRKQKTV